MEHRAKARTRRTLNTARAAYFEAYRVERGEPHTDVCYGGRYYEEGDP